MAELDTDVAAAVAQHATADEEVRICLFSISGDYYAVTVDVLAELMSNGADICELGVPYSDPIADGPVIQASYTRALNNKLKVSDMLAAVHAGKARLSAPLVTMVSYAIIHRFGPQKYVDEATRSGLAGAIVPVDALGLFLSTVQVVLLPLVLGLALHHYTPKLVAKVLPAAPLVSVAFITLIVASVIGQNAQPKIGRAHV